jgi:hypothetical protein
MAVLATPRMALFMPGASPPDVRIPIFLIMPNLKNRNDYIIEKPSFCRFMPKNLLLDFPHKLWKSQFLAMQAELSLWKTS